MKTSSVLLRSPKEIIQKRLMILAVIFIFLACLILTFAPMVRYHSLQAPVRWQQWIGFMVWLLGFLVFYWQADQTIPDRDPYLLPITSLMTGWGLITQFRLDPSVGFRQTIWVAVCLIAIIIALRVPNLLAILRRYKYIWLMTGLVLVFLTFIFGTNPSGSGPNLWLGFSGVYLQPSEILKIVLVIYLAAYLADNVPAHFKFLQLLIPTLLVAVAALLILIIQRDLGTASLFIALYTVIIYLASGKRRFLLISFLVIVMALIAGYYFFDVIQLRVEAWLNPWLDANGRSYQIVQSIIAVANGGVFGRGIGLGSPGVVPVSQSDFIYPSMVEETGLMGALAIVLLFAIFTLRAFIISLKAPNQFQRFLAAGLATYFISQAILIMGGTIRMLPLTGVTLPFFSYGGSSLMVAMFSFLLLITISNQSVDENPPNLQTKAYFITGSVFLAALVAIFLVTAWWSVFRADNLVTRNDNPRRFISDQYVMRGKIVDRNNSVLAQTNGEPGSYERILNYPSLSALIGYSNINYGQGGLESSMDSILRGLDGNTFQNVFKARLLHSQYPEGADIRVSLDIQLQRIADDLMAGQKGGLVMLNADTGEILAMSTSPTFDANHLEENWETWKSSSDSPLLNRATQGLYPIGNAGGGLILAALLSSHPLPPTPVDLNWSSDISNDSYCAKALSDLTWAETISAGCNISNRMLNFYLGNETVQKVYKQVGFLEEETVNLSDAITAENVLEQESESPILTNILVNPLQMAVAYAPLSNGGQTVTAQLATAYHYPNQNWILFNKGTTTNPLNYDVIQASNLLANPNIPGWQINSSSLTESGRVDWYIAGTQHQWKGTSIILVIALEESTPSAAEKIGRQLFNEAVNAN